MVQVSSVGGMSQFEPILGFSHRDAAAKGTPYLQFTTAKADLPLEIAAGHYLYLADGRRVLPEHVRVGDALRANDPVVRIERVQKQGAFHPHTWSSKLVVNGFQTSTHTTYL